MTLYQWIYDLIIPLFCDVSQVENATTIFSTLFFVVLSGVLVHLCVYLPYRLFLYFIRYRKWGK